jgi:hypothetical protein
LSIDSAEKPSVHPSRVLKTNGVSVEIIGDFSVHAESLEAFLGFFSRISISTRAKEVRALSRANLQRTECEIKKAAISMLVVVVQLAAVVIAEALREITLEVDQFHIFRCRKILKSSSCAYGASRPQSVSGWPT